MAGSGLIYVLVSACAGVTLEESPNSNETADGSGGPGQGQGQNQGQGQGQVEMLTARNKDGGAGYVALERLDINIGYWRGQTLSELVVSLA
ncbi:MAG: hypothetical protein MK135_11130 [Polyangiaceae bacterium]|nr:hypothetical protein [Polyangiaceae bacterium]